MITGLGNARYHGAHHYGNAANKAAPANAAAAPARSRTDTVSISDAARTRYTEQAMISGTPITANSSTATVQKIAGKSLGKYANIGLGTGETNLTAMNFSRMQLGSKIDKALKAAGIELQKDERISLSVGADRKIKIAGIKDKEKLAEIEKALNQDTGLSREMLNHAATGRIMKNAKKQEDYAASLQSTGAEIPADIDELFTDAGVRAYVLDDYLQNEVGIGLDALGFKVDADGNETLTGVNQPLEALFSDDPSLQETLKAMFREGTAEANFSASFEFANGGISDPTSLDMAKHKIQSLKDKIMGMWDKDSKQVVDGAVDTLRKEIEDVTSIDDQEFRNALARGFAIRVSKTGEFEIVGGEKMGAKAQDILKGIVQKALDEWASEPSRMALDGTGGTRVANFADVAETFIEEHRFEHGDVDDHAHEVIINFAGTPHDTRVVSDAADDAQDEKNREIAGELGTALRDMLGKNGVDTIGLEMEVDENGTIIVYGDANDPNVQKAQQLLDAFVQETEVSNLAAGEDDKDENARVTDKQSAKERFDMHFGVEKEEYTPEGWARRDIVLDGDTPKEVEETLEEALARGRPYTPEERERRIEESWQKIFPGKNPEKNIYNGMVSGGISNIDRSKLAGRASGSGSGRGSAADLYRELVSGMQFHDKFRTARYSL